jgi:predicted O-methyltransferase YrrM
MIARVNAERRAVAQEIRAAARAHDELQADRRARFRNVEPETAELLAVLIRATGAQRILELGGSNGYSTIWLADAAEATGGLVTSVEIEAERTALARTNLARATVRAELRTQDAAQALADSADGAWDFVFLDAERPAYAGYWPELLRSVRPTGGLIAIDNVLSHADETVAVGALIEAEPSVSSTLVPIGAGVRLVVRGEERRSR